MPTFASYLRSLPASRQVDTLYLYGSCSCDYEEACEVSRVIDAVAGVEKASSHIFVRVSIHLALNLIYVRSFYATILSYQNMRVDKQAKIFPQHTRTWHQLRKRNSRRHYRKLVIQQRVQCALTSYFFEWVGVRARAGLKL